MDGDNHNQSGDRRQSLRSPVISVVVPAHNSEAFLSRCLDSLCAQSFPDFEVILVDDGSADGSLALLERYASRFSSCTVIHQSNQGISAARNAGVRAARGAFIGFVDSDDSVPPSFLETHRRLISQTGCDITQAEHLICSKETEPVQPAEQVRVLSPEGALQEMFKDEHYSVCTRLYARHLFESPEEKVEDVFPEGLTCEDRVANFTLISRARCVAATNRIEYVYYRNVGSISYSGLDRRGLDLLTADSLLIEKAHAYGSAEVLRLAEDRAAKGAYSLLVKYARFGVTDDRLDETITVPNLRRQYLKDYPRLIRSQLSLPKKIVAWQLRYAPALLKAEFSLYNALTGQTKKKTDTR